MMKYSAPILLLLALPVSLGLSLHTSASRRDFMSSTIGAVASLSVSPAFAEDADGTGVRIFKLPSALQYIEMAEGVGNTPRYGQLCSIKYTAYVKLPNSDKEKFDQNQFLIKHGNGRTIPGLDEGLHTMKVGGKRRLIIPPKLGFLEGSQDPVPVSPFARRKLNKMLDKMVEVRAGNFIYDVELVSIIDDEADQGYYEDLTLTNEQFDLLRENVQAKIREAQMLRAQQGGNSAALVNEVQ